MAMLTEEITSVQTGTLVVTVFADGEPVSGRTVAVREAAPDSAVTGQTTGEDGKATFTLVGGKQYSLSTAIEPGAPAEQGSVLVPAGEATEFAFAFHRIFGHIVDAAGDPIKQRPLSVRMSTTDDPSRGPGADDVSTPVDQMSGEFGLLAAPGTYLFECLEQGELRGQLRVTVKHAAVHISITLFDQAAAN